MRYWKRDRVTLRLDALLVERVDLLAKTMGLTRGAVVEVLLVEALAARARAWGLMVEEAKEQPR